MLTFLKKAGLDILKGISVVAGLAPLLQATMPNESGVITKVASELELLKTLIIQIEAMGASLSTPMSGADKLKAAAPQVTQIILNSAMFAGHKIQDQQLANIGSEQIASGIANWLNALEPK